MLRILLFRVLYYGRYRATLLRGPCTRDPISLGLEFGMITPGHSMACLEWLQLGEENLSGVSGFRGINRCIIIGLGSRGLGLRSYGRLNRSQWI